MKTVQRVNGVFRVSRRGNWLLGCGIVLAVVVIILVAGGVFVAMNIRNWSATAMSSAFSQILTEAPIEAAEKAETQAVLDAFVQDFKDKKISYEQLGLVFQNIVESPVLPAGIAIGVGHGYFEDSALTPEEKAEGNLQVARIAHGLADETLEPGVLRDVLAPLRADPSDPEAIQFNLQGTNIRVKQPEKTTPDELRAFIAMARETADSNSLPPTPPPFDLSGELQKAIDAALNPTTDPADAVPEVPATETPDAPAEEPGTSPAEEPAP